MHSIDAMNDYFVRQIAVCKDRQAALVSDDRTDEANFEKIRANVYDIFRTILSVAQKMADPKAFFLKKLEEIPANWVSAKKAALSHGDEAAAHIETIKLETKDAIRAEFLRIWEE